MSSGSAKLLFVSVFIVNCLLWSQSRYTHIQTSNTITERSLTKRIYLELTRSNVSYSEDEQCRPLAFPVDAQCSHVWNDCPAPETFLSVPYLRHYFCTKPPFRPLAFAGLLIWLIFLFSTLGISASDFFTPNLASIAQLLGLDENVAGVTFLAFGNGSPDVFSTFSAMRANSGSLAIGELLGAASFIVSCVVGSMCIIKPFKVDARPFLRDVGFFTVAVGLLLTILWDGRIHAWEAGSLVCLYLFYVALVVVGSWYWRKREKEQRMEALIRSEYDENISTPPFEPYRDEPSPSSTLLAPTPRRERAISSPAPPRLGLHTDLPPRPHSRTPSPSSSMHYQQMPSFSLVGALEFREVVASLQHQASSSSLGIFDSPVTPFAGGHYHRSISRSRRHSREFNPFESALGVPLDERSPPHLLVTPASERPGLFDGENDDYGDLPHSQGSFPSISRTLATPTSSDVDTESLNHSPPTRRQKLKNIMASIYHTLFPSLHRFRSKSTLGKIASVFAAPAVMLLTLTLPVLVTPYNSHHSSREKPSEDGNLIGFDEEDGAPRALLAEEIQEDLHDLAFNKWLMAVQCVLGPLFAMGVLFNGTKHEIWLLIATAVAGLASAAVVAVFADKGDHPTSQIARCSMGFFVAIVWIMAIADEVVNVLQTFGFIFGLSDAIIGLTIFAVGNSLADLVANMSVAAFAPIMGFSACFGGPMLNILLGVGISGSYVIQHTAKPYELHFSQTLFVSTVGLLALLVATLVFVPLNGYFLSMRWGIFLIASYTIIMCVNIFVELRGG